MPPVFVYVAMDLRFSPQSLEREVAHAQLFFSSVEVLDSASPEAFDSESALFFAFRLK